MSDWMKGCLVEVCVAIALTCMGIIFAVFFTAGVEYLADLAGRLF